MPKKPMTFKTAKCGRCGCVQGSHRGNRGQCISMRVSYNCQCSRFRKSKYGKLDKARLKVEIKITKDRLAALKSEYARRFPT
jgi:hypothetical protein